MWVKLNTPQTHLSIVVWSILTCGVAEVRFSKKRIPSPQITNHRVLLLLSGASLEEKSPVTFGSVGIPWSIACMVTQHIAQRAHRERGSLHCASDCWLLYLVVTHAAERAWMLPVNMWSHVCMCIIQAAAHHTAEHNGRRWEIENKTPLYCCCCCWAMWMGELSCCMRERDRKDQIVFHVGLLSDVSFICNNNIRQS